MRTLLCLTMASLLLCVTDLEAAGAPAEEAATVTLAVGQVTDQAADGTRRVLKDDDVVYSGDTLSTAADSWLDLQYDDEARMILRPDTQFFIERFHFNPDAHPDDAPPTAAATQESAFFRLIKGGLRAVSGLIGHVQRDRYRLDTPVATIGIRGTEYTVRYCAGDCGDEADKGTPPANGLYTGVDLGAIAVGNKAGETITSAGQFAYTHDERSAARLLRAAPAALRDVDLPDKYKRLEEERARRGGRHRHERLHHRKRHRPGGGG